MIMNDRRQQMGGEEDRDRENQHPSCLLYFFAQKMVKEMKKLWKAAPRVQYYRKLFWVIFISIGFGKEVYKQICFFSHFLSVQFKIHHQQQHHHQITIISSSTCHNVLIPLCLLWKAHQFNLMEKQIKVKRNGKTTENA